MITLSPIGGDAAPCSACGKARFGIDGATLFIDMVRHRRMRLLSRLCGGNGSVIKAATQPMLMQRRHAFRLCLCRDESGRHSHVVEEGYALAGERFECDRCSGTHLDGAGGPPRVQRIWVHSTAYARDVASYIRRGSVCFARGFHGRFLPDLM